MYACVVVQTWIEDYPRSGYGIYVSGEALGRSSVIKSSESARRIDIMSGRHPMSSCLVRLFPRTCERLTIAANVLPLP
jgi:hypothetical protein